MDFSSNSYFNNLYREELIFRVWNTKVLGTHVTEKVIMGHQSVFP